MSSMHVSAYAYPWDVARTGVERYLGELVEQGIGAVDLATSYHPIDALSSRDGVRFYTSSRGAVHMPARRERYGRIAPAVSEAAVCAAWPEVAARARALDIAVNAWTVTLFQPWIVDAHPDCARVLPSGDPVSTGVCPANADVREFLACLCDDVVDQFDVDLVRLESIMPLGYNLDWLRPRVLVEVPRTVRELLTVCFCATCVQRGVDAGLDVGRLQGVVHDAIESGLGGRVDIDGLRRDDELDAFLAQHEQASIELLAGVEAKLGGTRARLASTIRTPFGSLRPDVNEALTVQIASLVHQLPVGPGKSEVSRRIASIAAGAPHDISLSMLITRGLTMPNARPDHAPLDDPLPGQLAEAVELGVDEIGLYGHSLLPTQEVQHFMSVFRAAAEL